MKFIYQRKLYFSESARIAESVVEKAAYALSLDECQNALSLFKTLESCKTPCSVKT